MSEKHVLQRSEFTKKFFEWFGVITAIFYSLFVASNTGLEFLGFTLLLTSAMNASGLPTRPAGALAFTSCLMP